MSAGYSRLRSSRFLKRQRVSGDTIPRRRSATERTLSHLLLYKRIPANTVNGVARMRYERNKEVFCIEFLFGNVGKFVLKRLWINTVMWYNQAIEKNTKRRNAFDIRRDEQSLLRRPAMNNDTTNNTPKQLPLLFPPEHIEIPLSKTGKKYAGKYTAIVSPEDADLADLNWAVLIESEHCQYAHRGISREGKYISVCLHRVVIERKIGRPLEKHELPDHINGDGLDNRRENLRVATSSQNSANRKKRNPTKSRYKGVIRHKNSKKWRAAIRVNGKSFHLGYYATEELAHAAYRRKADELFGEFANYDE